MGNLIFGGGSSAQEPQQQAAPPQQSSGNLIFGGGGPAPAPTTGNVANLGGLIPEMPQIPGTEQLRTFLGKALDAQGNAVRQKITGKPDYNSQMAELRHRMPPVESTYNALGGHQGVQGVAGHAAQGLIDAAIAQPLDPLTYETAAAGPVVKGLGLAGKLEPLAVKAVNASGPIGRLAHDFFTYGGEQLRAGYDVPAIQGASNRASREGSIAAQRMQAMADKIINGKGRALNDEEKVRVGQTLNGQAVENLTPKEQSAVHQLRRLTNTDLGLRRNAAQTVAQSTNPLKSVEELQQMAHEAVPARENYFPGSHEVLGEKVGRPAMERSPLQMHDPRALERDELKVTEPSQLEAGFHAMTSNTGRQVATQKLHEILGPLINDPQIEKMFKQAVPATGDFRNDWQKVVDGLTTAIGYPRAGVVSTTPRHVFNIYDLAVNTVPPQKLPAFTAKSVALIAKLMKAKSIKEYEGLVKPGTDLGAISGSFKEKAPFFQKFPDFVPGVGGKKIPGLSQYSHFMNKLTWASDEAFKTIYAQMIAGSGEASGLRAGGLAARRLVDYEHLSPFQKLLSGRGTIPGPNDTHIPIPALAPFGTFRGGIPGAAAGGIARNPARAAFLNRATGGAMFGDKPQGQQTPGLEFSNPTADVGRLANEGEGATAAGTKYPISGLGDFLRGTIGALPAMGSDVAQDTLGVGQHFPDKNWATYGQGILPARNKTTGKWDIGALANYALSGIPEAQAVLQAMGISRFQWRGLAHEAVRQATGVQYNPPQQP